MKRVLVKAQLGPLSTRLDIILGATVQTVMFKEKTPKKPPGNIGVDANAPRIITDAIMDASITIVARAEGVSPDIREHPLKLSRYLKS